MDFGVMNAMAYPVTAVSRDAGQGGISMATASIIKKYKRTLVNFQEMLGITDKRKDELLRLAVESYKDHDLFTTSCKLR